MNEFIQLIFTGLTVGFIYTLIALGYTFVYQAKKIINFSQGEIVMLGGIMGVIFFQVTQNIFATFFLANLVCVIFAYFLKQLVEISRNSDVLSLIVLTIGYSFFIRGLVEILIGKNIFSFSDSFIAGGVSLTFYDAIITFPALLVAVISLVILFFLFFFLKFSKWGKAVLGTSENELAAKLMGINIKKVYSIIFVLSAMIGASGGILLTNLSSIHYESGIILGLKGFIAAVLGGIGIPLGAVLGGLLLGVSESFFAGYVSTDYKDALTFLILIICLLVKPTGLLGKAKSY